MTMFASCGHELKYGDDGVFLALAEFDRTGARCVSYGTYCPECAKELAEYVLHDEGEENKWLGGGKHTRTPVAYWNPDESLLAFKHPETGNWVPLYTE